MDYGTYHPDQLIDPETGKVSRLTGEWENLGFAQGICTRASQEVNADGVLTTFTDITIGDGPKSIGRLSLVFKENSLQTHVGIMCGYEYRVTIERLAVSYHEVATTVTEG